ncbi:Hypothetical_protein [Hexamita inflata]|uniref:Hypothetical_protein n=1 Tax=Hexamita inflata TaxID=28002 RepID=A0AA86PD17_9EUKA|nr:Hypothetical protein HINF_LOCUS24305 [Hexamita inflata]
MIYPILHFQCANQLLQLREQNDLLNCNLIISTKAQFNHSIFISQIMTIHKSKYIHNVTSKLISTSYLIFQDCHSEQPPQTTQVSSALELTLLTSKVIFVTIFGMAGMNLGTSVSAATRSASKFRAGNNVDSCVNIYLIIFSKQFRKCIHFLITVKQ